MPPPVIDRGGWGIMFSGCPSVRPSVRACVRAIVLLARYLANHWTKFHQTLVDDVVKGTDKLIRFWRSRSQRHSDVKHLSELLLRTEASNYHLFSEHKAGLSQSAALFQLRIRVNLPSPLPSCPSPPCPSPPFPFLTLPPSPPRLRGPLKTS